MTDISIRLYARLLPCQSERKASCAAIYVHLRVKHWSTTIYYHRLYWPLSRAKMPTSRISHTLPLFSTLSSQLVSEVIRTILVILLLLLRTCLIFLFWQVNFYFFLCISRVKVFYLLSLLCFMILFALLWCDTDLSSPCILECLYLLVWDHHWYLSIHV